MTTNYYDGREQTLCDVFGATSASVGPGYVELDERRYPVVDDVIIALEASRLPARLRARLGATAPTAVDEFAPDIQFTFGEEWMEHGEVLPEHVAEFAAYFDLVDVEALGSKRLADLGCGSGRWAHFLAPRCHEIVLTDFSEAIFVARRNLAGADNAVFVMADVTDLPFADDAFDLAYCLGVLHHLPVDALTATRRLARLAPELLVYLYYALDNRPGYYRAILQAVTAVRTRLSRITDRRARAALTWLLTLTLYAPVAALARVLPPAARARIPLADTYAGNSLTRLRQDAYDRFFTRIEQRVDRRQIRELEDTFGEVRISDGLPYWHFLCRR